jgi:hypothetical protein
MEVIALPYDVALAHKWGGGLGARQMRFLVDNASFLFRGLRKGWLDAAFVSTEQKRSLLELWGVSATVLPVGQQPGFGRDIGLPRDIDVLFVGSLKTQKRRNALVDLVSKLRRRGLVAHVPEDVVWGEARTRLVNRSRMMLHLHQFSWDTPWIRWCIASANGAVVVSETLSVPTPLRPGIDYLEAPLESLADEILALSRDEPRRLAMRDACRARIDATMTQAASLDHLARRLTELARKGEEA